MRSFLTWVGIVGVAGGGTLLTACEVEDPRLRATSAAAHDTLLVDTHTAEVSTPTDTRAEEGTGDLPTHSETITVGETIAAGETIAIGEHACCLTFDAGRAVWVDGGSLWVFHEGTGATTQLTLGPGTKKDPVLSGSTLVWADDRGGDWDLWGVDLDALAAGTGSPALIRGGLGDQTEPSLDRRDATRLVWVENADLATGALGKDIWTMRIGIDGSARALTSDSAEQAQPVVSGSLVVWADYRNDPDARYTIVSDPILNDADIYGWDLDQGAELEVVVEPSKQLAPAIDGVNIVWLDWRGINPEPKYSEFQVYGRKWPTGPERFIAYSTWTRPELWRRPAILGDVAVFAAEPRGNVEGFKTLLYGARIGDGDPWIVTASRGVIDSVSLHAETAAWLGGGILGRASLMVPTLPR